MPNPHNPSEKCSTCRFYQPGQPAALGRCHRFPPPESSGTDGFPFCTSGEWCGEYEQIPTAVKNRP
jgi:hypothetical protein